MTLLKPDFEEENESAIEAHPVLLWWAEAVSGLNRLPQDKRARLVSHLTQELYQIIPYDQDLSFQWLPIHAPDSVCLEAKSLRPNEMNLQTKLLPLFDEASPLDQLKPVFRRSLEQQCADGVPLQHLVNSLDQIGQQLQEQIAHTTERLHVADTNFDEVQPLHQRQQGWASYIDRERQRLSGLMANRNHKGKDAERQSDITAAIELYEANLRDRFTGTYPYERLRIIYTRQGQYADAIRVCCAYLHLPDRPHGQNKEHFRHHLERLTEKEGAQSKEK